MHTHAAGTLSLPASVVTIGAFDGVHRGHQALILRATKRAERLSLPTVVYTFDPPPRSYLRGAKVLTSLPEKLRRLETLRVDHVVVAKFDAGYMSRTASDFLQELAAFRPAEVWVGSDFRFGPDREGDVNTLAACFAVRVMDPVRCSSGKTISSSRIRALVTQGALSEAWALLGW